MLLPCEALCCSLWHEAEPRHASPVPAAAPPSISEPPQGTLHVGEDGDLLLNDASMDVDGDRPSEPGRRAREREAQLAPKRPSMAAAFMSSCARLGRRDPLKEKEAMLCDTCGQSHPVLESCEACNCARCPGCDEQAHEHLPLHDRVLITAGGFTLPLQPRQTVQIAENGTASVVPLAALRCLPCFAACACVEEPGQRASWRAVNRSGTLTYIDDTGTTTLPNSGLLLCTACAATLRC